MIDPSKPNATIELETADLLQLGQSGLVTPAVNKTRELQLSDLEELREGMPLEDPKVMVDLGPDPTPPAAAKEQNVFIDFGPDPNSPPPRAGSVQMPAARVSSPLAAQQPRPSTPMASVVVEASMVEQRPPTPIPVAALVAPPIRTATPVNVQRVTPTMPRVESRASTAEIRVPRQGGAGLVVLVYLISAAALATSIYFRWFA